MKRLLVAVLVLLVALPLLAVAAASWLLNGDALKTRLADQVRRATGRELTIAGPVHLAWSLHPAIALDDVSLANPPGFARPQMAHADRIEASVALWPLLERRVEIARLAVAAPVIHLERDAAGRPNWQFQPPAPPAAPAAVPSQPASGPRFTTSIGTVSVTDASVSYGAQTVTAPHLGYDPRAGRVDGELVAAGARFVLSGSVQPGPTAPLDLHLTGSGLTAALSGTAAAATLTVEAPDLAALSPLAGRTLPPIHDVAIAATLPGPADIRIRTGAAQFGPVAVTNSTLTAAALGAPATFAATAAIGALPLAVTGHLGSLAALLAGPTPAGAPVDARIEAPGLRATAAGTLAPTGAARLRLSLASPDLGAAGLQAGLRLPAFRDLDATADLSLAPGQLALAALHLTSAQGSLSGDLAATTTGRPSLRGTLTATRLDLDSLAPPSLPAPSLPTTSLPAPPAAAPAVPQPAPRPARVIPDTRLPLASLRDVDADLTFAADALHLGGADYRAVQAHADLHGGTLRLDPVAAAIGPTPAAIHATLVVDAAAAPPALHLTLEAPGLPFGALLAPAGGPADAPGTLDLRADLAGTGDTVRAVAATLTGHLGLALVDGRIANETLERLAAGLLRTVNVPLEAGGSTAIRCAALRADADAGRLAIRALSLDTSKLALDGTGSVDLRDEALDLHVRPLLRLGGGLSVPLRIGGTLAAPKAALDPGAIASGRVGILLGGPAPADTCGPALAVAREEAPPPPAAAPARAPKPADLLRSLLR